MDKFKHMGVGLAVSLAFTAVAIALGGDPWFGLLMAAVFGAAKELIDDHGPGHEEFMDFFATTAPGIIPPLVMPWLLSLIGGVA